MEMKDIIEKVNYYSRLAKERELTPIEKEEREMYRAMYLEKIKGQVRQKLESIEIVDEKKMI